MGDPLLQLFAGLGFQPAPVVGKTSAHGARQCAQLLAGSLGFVAQRRRDDIALEVGHRLETMRQQRLQRVGVGHRNVRADIEARRDPQHRRQAHALEQADRGPADIELELAQRELGRTRKGVMVVMQFFAADPHAPGREIGCGVGGFEIAISPPVSQAIHHTRRPKRNPRHLQRPHEHAFESEQQEADDQQQHRTAQTQRSVDLALKPIVRRTLAVLLDHRAVFARFAIQICAAPQHGADTLDPRAVRVVFGFAFRVMFAMDRHPLLGDHRCGQPRPEAEDVIEQRMEIDAAMRLAAMQVQRDREDGQLRRDQEIHQQRPPTNLSHAGDQEIEEGRGHGGGIAEGQGEIMGLRDDNFHTCAAVWVRNKTDVHRNSER